MITKEDMAYLKTVQKIQKNHQEAIDELTRGVVPGTKEFDLIVDLMLAVPNTTLKQVAEKLKVPYAKMVRERSRYVDVKITNFRNIKP